MEKSGGWKKDKYLQLYEKLMIIRLFEEKVDELFCQAKIIGAVHTSIGQEAVAVGVAEAMNKKDLAIATHRGHGHCLMRGAGLKPMMAELFGKSTGCCRGKGGSMHIVDVANGMLGANGIVGAGIPIAVGVGTAIKMQKSKQVVACFFGDNASNGGAFHESLNVAAIRKLPVVFICENNLYGISVSVKKSCAIEDIALRSKSYGIPGEVVDGMDVVAVYETAEKAIARARSGKGPSLLECKTYRFLGHSRGDPPYGPYRTKQELDAWKKRDPRLILIKKGKLTESEVTQIDKKVAQELEAAVRFAEESPVPEVFTALDDVYSENIV